MTEQTYSENPVKFYIGIVSVPILAAAFVVAGAVSGVRHFAEYLPHYSLGLCAVSALVIVCLTYGSETGRRSLQLDPRALTFHSGGRPVTVLWREIAAIECEMAADVFGVKSERVTIKARTEDASDVTTYGLDYNYGLEAPTLCQLLRSNWMERVKNRKRAIPGHVSINAAIGARKMARRASDAGLPASR